MSGTDAPTRIRPGSHLDMARKILAPAGEAGLSRLRDLSVNGFDETAGCPEVLATGEAGTVYLCHPFLVHAAQPHRGPTPPASWRSHPCTRLNRSGLSERTAIIRRLNDPFGKPCRRADNKPVNEAGAGSPTRVVVSAPDLCYVCANLSDPMNPRLILIPLIDRNGRRQCRERMGPGQRQRQSRAAAAVGQA